MAIECCHMKIQGGVALVSFDRGTEVIQRGNDMLGLDSCNALWDFRGCLPSDEFGFSAVERIINYVSFNPEIQWNPRLGFLVEKGVQYGLSRIC